MPVIEAGELNPAQYKQQNRGKRCYEKDFGLKFFLLVMLALSPVARITNKSFSSTKR